MSLKVHNRCLYGSRIYSTAHKDSDFDYLYILDDESMEEAWQLCQSDAGTLVFADPDLSPQPFTDAYFRKRDFLLFFDAPEQKTSAALISRSHYEALIRSNTLWVLEILFSDDRFKWRPELCLSHWSLHVEQLKAQLKYEIQYALSKGIAFLGRDDLYRAHKNFYFAHRFVCFVKQILAHGAIVDYEEPVSLFYLRPLDKAEAVASVREYMETIPGLEPLGDISLEGRPLKIAPSWVEARTIHVKGRKRREVVLDGLGSESIVVNQQIVPTPGGQLTRGALIDANASMAYLSILRIFGETIYIADFVPPVPSTEV